MGRLFTMASSRKLWQLLTCVSSVLISSLLLIGIPNIASAKSHHEHTRVSRHHGKQSAGKSTSTTQNQNGSATTPAAPQALVKAPAPFSDLVPPQPDLPVSAYILLDANSGQVLAEKNPDGRLYPASLTKLMTMYVVSGALADGKVHADDMITISPDAWKTGGSRMFVQVGTQVQVRDLIQGIIVDSGNDACVAMAERIAGTETAFADMMNQQARTLGMANTHFMDSTGLPNPNHYTTARDLAKLAVAIIQHYPNDYAWYKQKWFSYNNIRQPNRNRLLWEDASVDGLKTGHTDEAGFCLVASAERHGMRLVSVILGAANDHARALTSQQLLNYGYAFFETHKLYTASQPLREARIWKGTTPTASFGLNQDLYLTVPAGKFNQLKTVINVPASLEAPIQKGQPYGSLAFTLDGKSFANYPVVALANDEKGGVWRVIHDSIAHGFNHLFHRHADETPQA